MVPKDIPDNDVNRRLIQKYKEVSAKGTFRNIRHIRKTGLFVVDGFVPFKKD